MITDLSDATYSEFVTQTDDVIFIDFYTPMCSACQELMPVLGMLENHFGEDGVQITRVDVSKNPKLGKKYSVSSVPLCVVVGKDKMVKEAELGANVPEHYVGMINRALGKGSIWAKLGRIFSK